MSAEEPTTTARYIDVMQTQHNSQLSSPSPSTSPSLTNANTSPTSLSTQPPPPVAVAAVPPTATTAPTNGNLLSTNNNVYLIGLEFVRQYYTVLHQGPLYLHRFYSESSAFVHDDSKAVHGQQEIRERIQQLNFRNAVAKILQVDSQETLGNGVVIQVRGELSNNGKRLRRFMQTFVLAPQSPKRYYVRNDIFHYEDDDPKEELNTSSTTTTGVESSLSNEHMTVDDEHDGEKSEEVDEDGDGLGLGGHDEDHEHDQESDQAIPSVSAGSPTSLPDVCVSSTILNNKSDEHDVHEHGGQDEHEETVVEVSVLDSKSDKDEPEARRPSHGFITTPSPTPMGGGDEETTANTKSGGPGETQPSAPVVSAPVPLPASSGPKTYANLFKSTPAPPTQQPFSSATSLAPGTVTTTNATSVTSTSPFPNLNTNRPTESAGAEPPAPAAISPQPPSSEHQYGKSGQGLPPRHGHFGHRGGYHHHRDQRRERLTSRSSNATNNDGDTGSIDGDHGSTGGGGNKSSPRFPDSHQLFVGNLPHTATQIEIKDIFDKFGRVAEVKILKPGMKNSGPKVPYFCFVIYEKPAFAQAALNEKNNIKMRMPDGSHRRLNVEEKRPRENYYFHRDREHRDNANNSTGGPTQQNQQQHQGNHFRQHQHHGGGGSGSNNVQNQTPEGSSGTGGTGKQNRTNTTTSSGTQSGAGGTGQGQGQRTHTRTFRGSNRSGTSATTTAAGGGGGGTGGGGGAR